MLCLDVAYILLYLFFKVKYAKNHIDAMKVNIYDIIIENIQIINILLLIFHINISHNQNINIGVHIKNMSIEYIICLVFILCYLDRK